MRRTDTRKTTSSVLLLLAAALLVVPRATGAQPTGRVPFDATSGAASDTLEMVVDLESPEVTLTSPPFGSVLGGGSVTFSGTVTDRASFDAPPGPPLPVFAEVIWNVWDQELGMVIQTGRVPVVDGRFTVPDLSLAEGEYLLGATAMDAAGNIGFGGVVVLSDPDAPALALVTPLDGEAVLSAEVAVDLNFAVPTTIVAVNGTPDGRSFPAGFAGGALTLPLAFGANAFTLDVESGGSASQFSFTLFRVDELGQVRIESLLDGELLNTPTVSVRGTVPRGTPLVEVNGIPATIAADGVSFEVAGVPIREGTNRIRAVAYPLGRETLVTVTGDFTPPRFLAWMPEDGTATTAPEVTVAGFLSEGATLELAGPAGEVTGSALFAGLVGSGPFSVPRYRFDLGPLALDPGPNALLLRATDGAGNVAEETLTLTRSDGALLFAAPTAPVPALRADVTLQALEPVTLVAWYAEGRRVPAVEGGTLSTGFVPVPNLPLLPGANAMRVVYQRAGGPPELLTFAVESSATEIAVVEGVVTDTATGLPVAGALVQITVNGLTLAVVTDAEGRYRVEVEPGVFVVAAVGEGYAAGGASGTGTGGGTTVADVGLAPTGLPGIQNQVAIVVPPDGTVTDFEQVTVVGTLLNPSSVVTVNGIGAEVVGNRFTARHVPLAMGANTLQVTASALGSPVATDSVSVTRADEPVLAVKIFSPPEGATIPGSGLVVRGFVSAKRARTLVTDGFAPVVEGVFEVTEVRVPQGAATIGALAQLAAGEEAAHDTVAITVLDSAPAIRLLADPRSGTVPLETSLAVVSGRSLPVARIDFDLDGDRELDVLASPSGTTLASYAEAGPRLARAYLTLPSGAEVSSAARVDAYLAEEVLTSFAVGNPVDLAAAPDGGFYVLDGAAGVVTRFDASRNVVATIGSGGAGSSQLANPQALAAAPDGALYVADTGNDRIQVFDADGTHRSTLGSEILDAPRGIALDRDVLAVSDAGHARVVFLAIDGSVLGELPIAEPRGIEGVPGHGFVVASPSAGLWSALPESAGVRARSIPRPELSAPVDLTISEAGLLVADAGRATVAQLSAGLGFQRTLAQVLTRPPRAVLASARREVPSIYVADGERVLEIAQPVPSPLPVVESLKASLRSGDVSGALSLFEPIQRLVFAEIYEDLGEVLVTDAETMGSLSIDLLREHRAIVRIEAELPTESGPETRRFPVYLVRAEDGTWQIFDY